MTLQSTCLPYISIVCSEQAWSNLGHFMTLCCSHCREVLRARQKIFFPMILLQFVLAIVCGCKFSCTYTPDSYSHIFLSLTCCVDDIRRKAVKRMRQKRNLLTARRKAKVKRQKARRKNPVKQVTMPLSERRKRSARLIFGKLLWETCLNTMNLSGVSWSVLEMC